jgi:DNA-binding Lrp family transcriptional regulator
VHEKKNRCADHDSQYPNEWVNRMKLTATDGLILSQIQFQARASAKEVARRVGVHQNTVHRVVDRLIERGVIAPVLRNNLRNLGGQLYTLYLAYSGSGASRAEQLLLALLKIEAIKCLESLSGEFDLVARIVVANRTELDLVLDRLWTECPEGFSRTCLLEDAYWLTIKGRLSHNSVSRPSAPIAYRFTGYRNIDELDFGIMRGLSNSPLISQRELARSLDAPVQTISTRLLRLFESQVLVTTEFFLDNSRVGTQVFLLLLRTAGVNGVIEQKVYSFCNDHHCVAGYGKRFGEWNYEILIEVSEVKELEQLRRQLFAFLGTAYIACSLLVMGSRLKWDWGVTHPNQGLSSSPSGAGLLSPGYIQA